ncbi:MAG TPA: intradiol ring-cleavage dioxygenase [Aggregatilineales bacterium]|nr:intradiol ring-cleavage dioxygenase [Aggregatilineales bacterium]
MTELHDDDKPIGRVLSRREVLTLLGGSSAALIIGGGLTRLVGAQATGTATPVPTVSPIPACVVRPELTEGPYFVDGMLNRMDIRIDPTDESIKEGLPLKLVYRVSDVTGGTCAPLAGAQVDVWHCDADGVYSGVQDRSFDTTDQIWLRGYQITDEAGIATFLTIVPGWYSGRAVHIHFKIRTEDGYEFTSQFFFDPTLIEAIYAEEPYAAKGSPDTPNTRDNIYQGSDDLMTLNLLPLTEEELEELDVTAGYSATFDIGLDLSDAQVGAADGFRR